jgi:hypothetical protein
MPRDDDFAAPHLGARSPVAAAFDEDRSVAHVDAGKDACVSFDSNGSVRHPASNFAACITVNGYGSPFHSYCTPAVSSSHAISGLPFDFDQIRVFTWNVRKHRYETAYREHGLDGVLPVIVTQENFDKEGMLPVFIVRVKDDAGNISERKYKLNTPIVRRVLAPGEALAKPARKRHR